MPRPGLGIFFFLLISIHFPGSKKRFSTGASPAHVPMNNERYGAERREGAGRTRECRYTGELPVGQSVRAVTTA